MRNVKGLFVVILLFLGAVIVLGQDPVPFIKRTTGQLTSRERRNLIKSQNLANRAQDSMVAYLVDFTTGTLYSTTVITDSASMGAVYYSDTYWDDLRVPLTNTQLNPALTEPDFEDNGTGLFAWGFDADGDSTEVLNFIAQLPHSYKEGTDIDAHLHWQPETTNTGDVAWKLNYAFASIDSSFSTVDSCWVVQAGAGVVLGHQLVDLGDIDGTNIKISAVIMGNISRVGDHTLDDFTGIAYGLELDFHFEIDAPGSDGEYIKFE